MDLQLKQIREQNINCMKYVLLKNSLNVLCVQLPEGFGSKLEIVCLDSQADFDEYLEEMPQSISPTNLTRPLSPSGETRDVSPAQYDSLFVRHKDYYTRIPFSDILWVEAARSYCCIHTSKKKSIILTCPLADVRKRLPPDQFIQTHRSYVVNAGLIDRFSGNVLYIGPQSIPISRTFKKKVMEHFFFLDNIKEAPEEGILPLEKKDTEWEE